VLDSFRGAFRAKEGFMKGSYFMMLFPTRGYLGERIKYTFLCILFYSREFFMRFLRGFLRGEFIIFKVFSGVVLFIPGFCPGLFMREGGQVAPAQNPAGRGN